MTYTKPTLKNEMINFLRNSDVFTIAERGVTTKTDTGTFTTETTYTVSTSPTKLKNIRSVFVGTTLKYGRDYSFSFETGVISFVSAQNGAYTIIYDYGNTEKIYPDFPRDDLQLSSYPRLAVDIIDKIEDVFGVGGDLFIADTLFTIVLYSESYDYLESHLVTIEQLLRTNAKNFYNTPFVKPIGRGPILKSDNRSQVLLQCNVDCLAMFEVQSG